MASRRESQVWVRKGSMLRERLSRLGVRGVGLVFWGEERMEEREGGSVGREVVEEDEEDGERGSWWRKLVTRWELWIWRGSSTRMSW